MNPDNECVKYIKFHSNPSNRCWYISEVQSGGLTNFVIHRAGKAEEVNQSESNLSLRNILTFCQDGNEHFVNSDPCTPAIKISIYGSLGGGKLKCFFSTLPEFASHRAVFFAALTVFQSHTATMSRGADSVETGMMRGGVWVGGGVEGCCRNRQTWTLLCDMTDVLWHPQPTPCMRCLLQLVTGVTNVAASATQWIRPARLSVAGCWLSVTSEPCWRWRAWNTDALTGWAETNPEISIHNFDKKVSKSMFTLVRYDLYNFYISCSITECIEST